jgi:phenylacetate-CoA ligase
LNRFKTALEVQGFPFKKAEKSLAEIKMKLTLNPSGYSDLRKWEIFNFHRKNNFFYKEFTTEKKIESWEDIPILTKHDLQCPLQKRLTPTFTKSEVFINKTSGSSGHPFVFAKDKFAHALDWANIADLYKQYNISIGKSLEARFYGISKDFKDYHKEKIKDKMAKRYRFDIFNLSNQNLSNFVEIFQKKPFEYINGYTSSIVAFAKYLKSENIILKDICPSLKICITTSEMLFESDKNILIKSFGIPIANEYGASEFGVMAFENQNLEWLLNNALLYIEVVNDDGQALGEGEEGHLAVTALYNKAHPFIRYKIGDIGVLNQTLDNSRQALEKLTGRTNVFAILPSGKKVPALSFYYVTKSVIEKNCEVKEFKVIQETRKNFLIKYVAENEFNKDHKILIQKAVDKYLEPGLNLEFTRLNHLERTKRGKLRQFESLL